MLDRVVGLASLVPFAIGALTGPAGPGSTPELTFQDPAIVESSGLVVRDGLVVTVNDSGDSGRIFVVDAAGRTVGTSSWPADPRDVEALAPAGPGEVWVADIGDNSGTRESVEVLRVAYGRGARSVTPTSYPLVYPDGPRNAETLLAHPRTGRLFVVSKDIFGGTVYAAPRRLSADRPNRLRAVADSLPVATDGAFFPDGRHYVVRGYGSARVYRFPGHEPVGSAFRLPAQRQGEGIAVAEDGTVHVSSEGQFSDVLRVDLPDAVVRAMRGPADGPSPTASPATGRATPSAAADAAETSGEPWWPWAAGGAVGLAFVALLLRLLLRHGAAS